MDDRELLELAAKAAKLDIWAWDEDKNLMVLDGWNGRDYWNPLTDDGDALRLAVKLKMMVNVRAASVRVFDENDIVTEESRGSDIYAATRRAIVRAAAEIGRAK